MDLPHELLKLFEDYRSKHSFRFAPEKLYEPVRYILERGGKRIRPLLTLMACDLFSGRAEEALPAAYAVELFHNFTLAHDDIMDQASLRRGIPTMHEQFGTAQAILSGDVMMICAYEFLNRLGNAKFRKVLDLFNTTAIRVCEGQQYDMNFQRATEVSEKEYLTMIEFKTAVLLACSLKVGAIIGDAGEEDANYLFEFGKNIGICFQLLDDLLDAFGEEGKFGKKIGGDIAQNKKTYLHIKAMEVASPAEKQKLIYYFSNNVPVKEKVKHVLEIYVKLGVDKLAREEANRYHHTAFGSLEKVSVEEEKKKILREFAEFMLKRKT